MAKPNINPWSPAPILSKSSLSWWFSRVSSDSLTPPAISLDCSSISTKIAQLLPSKPSSGRL